MSVGILWSIYALSEKMGGPELEEALNYILKHFPWALGKARHGVETASDDAEIKPSSDRKLCQM